MYRARHSPCPSHGSQPPQPVRGDRTRRTDNRYQTLSGRLVEYCPLRVQIRELSADIRPPSSDQATTLRRKSSTSVRSSETAASTACEPSSTAPADALVCVAASLTFPSTAPTTFVSSAAWVTFEEI